jgi:hypothetical protein
MSQTKPTNRIKTEENIVRTSEAVAPRITITWEPGTTNGTVEYQVMDMITENGVNKGMVPHTRLRGLTGAPVVRVSMLKILQSVIDIELPGGGTTQIPGALLIGAVKSVFDNEFNLQLAAQIAADEAAANPTPTPSPSVTPEPTPDP